MNLTRWETCRSYQGSLGIIAAMWKTFQGSPKQFSTPYKSVLSVLNRACLTQANKTKTTKKNFRFHSKLQLCGKKNIGKHSTFWPAIQLWQQTDFSQPYILHTDASEGGLGSVFYQKDEGYRVRITNINQIPSAFWKITVLGFKMGNHRTIFEIISFMPPSFTVYTDNNQSNDTIKLGQRMHRLLNMGLIKN